MKRQTFYFLQDVTRENMNAIYDDAENADQAEMTELWADASSSNLQIGIQDGYVVTETSPQSKSVAISLGSARDPSGRHLIHLISDEVALDIDSAGTSTDIIGGAGNHRIVSVFVRFKRLDSVPRIDGESNLIQTVNEEGVEFLVVQGSEYTTTPSGSDFPTLRNDAVLLCDVIRNHATVNTGNVANADIHDTDDLSTFGRNNSREDMFALNAGSSSVDKIRVGTPRAAIAAVFDFYNNHFLGLADNHDASDIKLTTSMLWADSSTAQGSGTTVRGMLEGVVDSLNTTGTSGADVGTKKVGGEAFTPTPGSFTGLTAAPLRDQLRQLANGIAGATAASSINYGGGGAWKDGVTNPATNLEAQLDKFLSDLTLSASTAADGAAKLGAATRSRMSGNSIGSQLDSIAANGVFENRANTFGLFDQTFQGNLLPSGASRSIGDGSTNWTGGVFTTSVLRAGTSSAIQFGDDTLKTITFSVRDVPGTGVFHPVILTSLGATCDGNWIPAGGAGQIGTSINKWSQMNCTTANATTLNATGDATLGRLVCNVGLRYAYMYTFTAGVGAISGQNMLNVAGFSSYVMPRAGEVTALTIFSSAPTLNSPVTIHVVVNGATTLGLTTVMGTGETNHNATRVYLSGGTNAFAAGDLIQVTVTMPAGTFGGTTPMMAELEVTM